MDGTKILEYQYKYHVILWYIDVRLQLYLH